jgi:hypothetical protein
LSFVTEGGVNSQTGNEGKFSCKRGELVRFKLGQIDLGYSACGEQIFVHDLVSSASGFSWGKVAAIIQTFSVNEGSYLDLSSVKQADLNLAGISFSDTDSDLATALGTALTASSDAYVDVATEKIPTAAVTVAAAQTAANAALSDSISMSDELESVLEKLHASGSPKKIMLTGKLSSESLIEGYDDTCWESIKAEASVGMINGSYTFNVDKAVSFDDVDNINLEDLTCASPSIDECEASAANELPQPKVITGNNISMVFSHEGVIGQLPVTYRNALTINTSIGKDAVEFKGVFENKATRASDGGTYSGKSMTCRYEVTASEAVETGNEEEDEGAPGEDPVAVPVVGVFSGDLACSGSTSLSGEVTVTSGDTFQAAFIFGTDTPWEVEATDFVFDTQYDEWSVSRLVDAGAPFNGQAGLLVFPLKEQGVDKLEVNLAKDGSHCFGELVKQP